jgi:hypothetical protein
MESTLPGAAAKRRAMDDGFALVRLDWAADFAKAMREPIAIVMPLFAYLAWKGHSDTFHLSNEILACYGVSRYAKYRALARLEKAGLIRVLQSPGRPPAITLLTEPSPKR